MNIRRIADEIANELVGYTTGAPEELTSQLADILGAMLSTRQPNAIKERLPHLVKLVEKIVLESSHCPRCDDGMVARVTLVEHGYQIDVMLGGKLARSSCRDFGGDWPIEVMQPYVAEALVEAMRTVEARARAASQECR